jgi:hypothetical protein
MEAGMKRGWILAVLFLVCSCSVGEVSPCAEGEVLDLAGECVPQACGLERFPTVPDDAPAGLPVLYVDAAGSDGDGSSPEAAKTEIRSALTRVRRDREPTVVLVAAGRYRGNLVINYAHDGLWLVGRCPELVTVASEDGEPGLEHSEGTATVRGLRLSGGTRGVLVSGGVLSLEQLTIDGAEDLGLGAIHSEVHLTDVVVANTRPLADGSFGMGMEIYRAQLSCTRCRVDGNTGVGVNAWTADTVVVMEDTEIRNTQPGPNGNGGQGIQVGGGAELSCARCRIEGNHHVGGLAGGAGTVVVLEDTEIRNTRSPPDGSGGRGLSVQGGAHLRCTRCAMDGNESAGVFADGGSDVVLEDTEVRNTQRDPAGVGAGIHLEGGARLTCTGCQIGGNWRGLSVGGGSHLSCTDCQLDGNHRTGVLAQGALTYVHLEDAAVRNTRVEEIGGGISVTQGAELRCLRCEIDGNMRHGVFATEESTEVQLEDSRIRNTQPLRDGRAGFGLAAWGGAQLGCTRCEIDGNHDVGVLAQAADTEVRLQHSTVRNTRFDGLGFAFGVVSQDQALVAGENLSISGNAGPGIYVLFGASLDLDQNSAITGNGFAGAVVLDGNLSLTGTHLQAGPDPSTGDALVGLLAWAEVGPPSILLNGVRFDGYPLAGAYLRGQGSYAFADCTFNDSAGVALSGGLRVHGNGIVAIDQVAPWDDDQASGLLVANSTFSQNAGVDILLDESSATLSAQHLPGATYQVVQQGCNPTPPAAVQLQDSAAAVDRCPSFERFIVPLDLRANPEAALLP